MAVGIGQRHPGQVPAFDQRVPNLVRGTRQADRELLEERRVAEQRLDAGDLRETLRGVGGLRGALPPELLRALGARATRGRRSPRSPSASGSCRCSRSPSRAGCAARAPAGSGRSRPARRRRGSPPRSGRGAAGRRPAASRSRRGTGRRRFRWLPSTCPSATAMSARRSPGGASTPSDSGSNTWIARAPPVVRRAEQLARGLEQAVRVRVLDDHAGDVVRHLGLPAAAVDHVEHLRLVARSPAVGPQGVHVPRVHGGAHEHAARGSRPSAPGSRPRPAPSPRRTGTRSTPRAR